MDDGGVFTMILYVLFMLSYFSNETTFGHNQLLQSRQIVELAQDRCILLFDQNFKFINNEIETDLWQLATSFEFQNLVTVGYADFRTIFDDSYIHFKTLNERISSKNRGSSEILIVHRKLFDRTCLYKPNLLHHELTITFYKKDSNNKPQNLLDLLNFINSYCNTYIDVNGEISEEGLEKKKLLENLYSVKERNDKKISMLQLTKECGTNLETFFYNSFCPLTNSYRYTVLPQCDVVTQTEDLNEDFFYKNILFRSKPTIFRQLAKKWPALKKWTNEYFRRNFGETDVHVKLTSSAGVFEGVEPIAMWNLGENFFIPDQVRENIKFPDLILVRPAGVEMKLNDFIDLIEKKNNSTVSAYIEYTHLNDYFKSLENDVGEFPFANKLHLKHLNFWFSDGNTLGKLHFDEYDNFLCQVKGRKQVILFEPHNNEELFEGYIIEGELKYDNATGFLRNNIKESTSLTMSPVNLVKPDFKKFPEFAGAYPLNCTIEEGDVLFIPSFWWHEVQSYPNEEEKRNLAVNFWYEPYFTKEFPCTECKLNFNSFYRKKIF